MTILATVYPLAAIAREIGGEYVSVEWLAESGQPLPGETVSEAVRSRARIADIVLSDSESWAGEGHDDPIRGMRIIRLDVLHASAASAEPEGLKWLDPAVAREVVHELCNRLVACRPKLEYYFRARAERFVEDLDLIWREYGAVLTAQPPRKALVISPDWSRLLWRFGIVPLIPVRSDPSALSAAQIRQLVETARQNGVTALLVHADTPRSVMRDLEDRTDLTILPMDALGSSAADGRDSYLELMRHNLDQLNQGASREP